MGDDASQYRAEWSTLAQRAPSDVYVPDALRNEPPAVFVCGPEDVMGGTPS